MLARLARLFSEGASGAPDRLRRPLALAVLMVETARADFDAAEQERDTMLAQLCASCELSAVEAERVLEQAFQKADEAVSLHEHLRLLNDELDAAAKSELMLWLWRVAYADGRLDPYEEARVRQLAELLYIPHAEFVRLRLCAQAECVEAGASSKTAAGFAALQNPSPTPEV